MKAFDDAFRDMLSDPDVLFDFIYMFIPVFVKRYGITPDDISVEKTEFLSSDLKARRPDVLCKIKIGDQETFVYILIEHQSEKDYNMPLRLFDYSARIWTHYVKKKTPESSRKSFKYPQIIPVVFYTGEESWTVEKNIGDKFCMWKNLKSTYLSTSTKWWNYQGWIETG